MTTYPEWRDMWDQSGPWRPTTDDIDTLLTEIDRHTHPDPGEHPNFRDTAEWLTVPGRTFSLDGVVYEVREVEDEDGGHPADTEPADLGTTWCPSCGGTGDGIPLTADHYPECPMCKGEGRVPAAYLTDTEPTADPATEVVRLECSWCGHWEVGERTKAQVAEWLRVHRNARLGVPNRAPYEGASTCPHPCGTPVIPATDPASGDMS